MSTEFKWDCPHCSTRQAGFSVVSNYARRDVRSFSFAFAKCGVCEAAIILEYNDFHVGSKTNTPLDLVQHKMNFPSDRFRVFATWPNRTDDAPENLPENVGRFFDQGASNERAKNWDAAGAMFRKALDVATKILEPSLANLTLFQRINKLGELGKVTADVATWAHEVRIDGNESVHGDEPETPEDVAAIHQFCRAFLTYTFTLPALVASRTTISE